MWPWYCDDITFYQGTLADWTIKDCALLTALGGTEALTGNHMLAMGTETISTKGPPLASFQNCLEPGEYVVSMDWRLYSEEFKEWCGSIYQDKFRAWLELPGGDELDLANYGIDDLCPPESCTGCGSFYNGLEQSDVDFDIGGVWNTPWNHSDVSIFVPQDGDGIVTLHLTVTDLGDSIYNTLLLVDKVQFQACGDGGCDNGETCGTEGEVFAGEEPECCEGLVVVDNSKPGDNGKCGMGFYPGYVCTKCYDGFCGIAENVCNCPEDCS